MLSQAGLWFFRGLAELFRIDFDFRTAFGGFQRFAFFYQFFVYALFFGAGQFVEEEGDAGKQHHDAVHYGVEKQQHDFGFQYLFGAVRMSSRISALNILGSRLDAPN